MKEVLIETDRGTIFGMSAGEPGAPLVLGIHGWSQRNGWHTWQPLMGPLATAGFHVVCLDMPGWGQSEAWSGGLLSAHDGVSAVVQAIDGLADASANLMGKSWGGGIALKVALDHPQRVKKLVLTAPAFREPKRLGALSQPVLMAWAEDDPVIPYQYASQFVDAIPNVELVTYPTGGHSAGPKNAGQFAPKVISFLGSSGQNS
ncbi:MAG TPA: alpha/beta fold hydrolase [Anaerolineae bacterium]|jgi:pimeloyl-ACP methyl ester carboxylesterase|nr:alpha/beta fold hydrolase [Anaerolineae bacterium]